MNIIIKIDDDDPILVRTDYELEVAVLYTHWKHIEMYDIDEISEVEKE